MDWKIVVSVLSVLATLATISGGVMVWRRYVVDRQAARASLSAEYLRGPTQRTGGGWEYCFRITNTGKEVAKDPRAWLAPAPTTQAVPTCVGTGLLLWTKSEEVTVPAASLNRPLKLRLAWRNDAGKESQRFSRVEIPLK